MNPSLPHGPACNSPQLPATCRFYVGGVAVKVTFCPEADVTRIHETLPMPGRLAIVVPKEEPGLGCFQIEMRPTEALLERPEVPSDRDTKQPA